MKRGTSGLCGILAIDKPKGVTSHDVVNAVRRLTNERRVGHAGTLDPMATGLLLVCVGAATRLSPYLTGHDKSYTARIVFGAATDTDDADGRIVTAYTHTAPGEGLSSLTDVEPSEVLESIVGTSMQLPPAYSAIKKNGVTAYKAAREGKEIELDPREITIYQARFVSSGFEEVDLDDGEGGRFRATLPYWDVDLSVSKGTYIRSIARDLGQRLGCGAHLSALRRTRVGESCDLEDAQTLEELAACAEKGSEFPWCNPVRMLGLPAVKCLTDDELKDVSNGRSLKGMDLPDGTLVACARNQRLMAIYRQDGAGLKPETVIPGGVCGVREWQWGDPWPGEKRSSVIVMGVFDGLHLGHRRLIADAYEVAVERNAPLTILTFEKDPDELFGSEDNEFKLQTNEGRLDFLRAYCRDLMAGSPGGEDACRRVCASVMTIPTTKRSMAQTPEDFLAYLGTIFDVKGFFVGEGFRFGAKAAGTTDMLGEWCEGQSGSLRVHELVIDKDLTVSSTRIRRLLAEDGDVQEACRLRAGHMHRISGKVVHGRGEGTDMGFATANMELGTVNGGVMLPLEGVYAGYACVRPQELGSRPEMLPAAINLGVAKSFENATAEVEVHVIGLEGDIYEKVLDVWFAKRLRAQKVFDDMDELIATVTHDIGWVRDNLHPALANTAIDPEGLAEY